MPNNCKINEKIWKKLANLDTAGSVFSTLTEDITSNLKEWESWIFNKDIYTVSPPKPYTVGIDENNAKSLSLF